MADKLNKADNASNSGPLQPLVDVVPKNIFKALSDMAMLQIIFFAVFFGIVLVSVEEPKRGSLIRAIDGLNDVFVGMVWMVMKAMPVFVFALMAGQIVKAAGTDPDKFQELLSFLLRYGLVVVLGLALMIFLVYPVIASIGIKGMTPRKFLKAMRDAQITAFSTSSSVATLPVTMRCVNRQPRGERAHHELRPAHRRHRQHGWHEPLPSHRGRGARPVPHGRFDARPTSGDRPDGHPGLHRCRSHSQRRPRPDDHRAGKRRAQPRMDRLDLPH